MNVCEMTDRCAWPDDCDEHGFITRRRPGESIIVAVGTVLEAAALVVGDEKVKV